MTTQDEAAALAAAKQLVAAAEAQERARMIAEAQARIDALTAFQRAAEGPRAALNAALADLEAALPPSDAPHPTLEAVRRVIANLGLVDGPIGSLIASSETTVRRLNAAVPTA